MRPSILAAVLALAACGPPQPRLVVRTSTNSLVDVSDDDDELVCKDERMTGTNMTKVVCRTPDEIAQERAAAQEWEKHPRNDMGPKKRR